MATTYTPNYNLAQPEVGGEIDTWGGLLNADLLTLDTTIKAVSDVANAAVPKAGGTMTGQLNITPASGSAILSLRKSGSTQQNTIEGRTAASSRWQLRLGDASAESGSNAGSDFKIDRFDDSGTFTDSPMAIFRSNGNVTFANDVTARNVTTTQNITSASVITTLQDFKASSANLVLSPTGTSGAVYVRPRGGSGTGETVFGQAETTSNVPIVGVSGTSNPASPYTFTLRGSGNFGGGLYLNDPGGGASFGIYLSSGNLIVGRGAVNGGGLTAHMQVQSGGIVSAVDFVATSDERLKTEIEPLKNATERLRQMPARIYRKKGRPEAGFIAQEVERVLATAVGSQDGFLTVSHGQIAALIAAAVMEVEARVTALEELI